MNNFEIFTTNTMLYKAIIVSCSQDTVTEYFSEIENILQRKSISGRIILDYYHPLLKRSFSNRFFEINFNGDSLEMNSLKALDKSQDNSDYISFTYSKIAESDFHKKLKKSLETM